MLEGAAQAAAGDLARGQAVDALDQAAAQAEADNEVFQIQRCHHHHGLIEAVVADGQGTFVSQGRRAEIRSLGAWGIEGGVLHGDGLRQVDAGSLGAQGWIVQSLCSIG